MIRFLGVIACLLIVGAVAGCGSAGPTSRDLVGAAHGDTSSFALVELSAPSLELVANWHQPSLHAVYGDYRSAQVQRVGVGDSVQINIWEMGNSGLFEASVTGKSGTRVGGIPEQVVARDGTVNVPYAGRIKVAGKTPAEVESLIATNLAGKTSNPQAMVSLTRNVSFSATVTGDVTAGARVPLGPNGDRILDVIAAAGGIKAPVHESFITLSREGKSLSVPMQSILANMKENVFVRPGDVVTVYRAPQSFTAFGATGRNALVGFDAVGITLDEAIAKAGGLLDDRSDPKGVFVLRYEPVSLAKQYPSVPPRLLAQSVVPVAYRLDMQDPTALFRARRFNMRDKDILYVSHAPITEVEKVLRLVQMLSAPAVTGASAYYSVNR